MRICDPCGPRGITLILFSVMEANPKKDVEGYVHKVSEVRVPASGNRYFEFKIQEREEEKRVICFSPPKRDELKDKEVSKEPVTLLNVSPQKRKYQPDLTEYRMNNYSKVVVKRNLSFPWKDIAGELTNTTIQHVLKKCESGDIVSLKGKVVSKSEEEIVFSSLMKKDLRKSDAVVGDSTGAIPVTFWENAIDKVEVDKCYEFKDFKVGYFKRRCLYSTPSSEIKEELKESIELGSASQEAAEELKPKEKVMENVKGSIVAVDAKKLFSCINCKNKVPDVPEDASVVRCTSCQLSMRKERMQASVYANIIVSGEDGEVIGRFRCSSSAVSALFTSIAATENYNIAAKDVTELSESMISETLLLVEKVLFKLNKDDKVIESMELVQD